MIDGQDPTLQQDGMNSDRYSGEFTISTAHELGNEVHKLGDVPAEEYFAILQRAAVAQEQHDMANAIKKVSNTSMGRLLHGSYEPVVTSMRDGKPITTQPAEQWAREDVAFGLGRALADLYDLEHSRTGTERTSTIADLRVDASLDKQLFVIFARIFAREPEKLDATQPTPDGVTDMDLMGTTTEDQAKGIGTSEEDPNKVVRFQKVTTDSTVQGFYFELWRHNRTGIIKGDGTDYHKLYLVRK